MYEKKDKIKRKIVLIIAFVYTLFNILSFFTNINSVQAVIKNNMPVSYMSDTFPASYNSYINALKSSHPNWVFKAVYTGLDFNEAITHESYDVNEGISTVPDSYDAAWKKDGTNYYVDGNFVIASKEAVKYMLDPRGHLNEKEVFQFQTLSYSDSMDSIDSIEKVLYGTSMYNRSEYQRLGSMVDMGRTYSSIILDAAKTYNVSAIHIASRIKQETGGAITSNRSINGSTSINGIVPYNFFNIGATPPNAITNGLTYAANNGWTDPIKAINGGTDILKNKWIKWGQDTTYFQKFDVNNPYGNAVALYAYQYMTNILAPTSESYSTHKAYEKMGMLNQTIEFHIPVFENMPEYPSPYPGESELTYVDDNTRIAAFDVAPYMLYIRSGPSTDYSIVAKLAEGDQMTRIAKSLNTQWDKVRLDNGVEGYVFRDYTKEVPTDIKVSSISFKNKDVELALGDSVDLEYSINPGNATNKEVEWSSSDNNIVSVNNGKITAKNKGGCTITVKSKDTGVTDTCNVNVVVKVKKINLSENELTLNVGEEKELSYQILPDNASNKEVQWYTTDSNIVEVNKGKLTAKNPGEAVVTVKSKDLNATSECKITVISKVENISLDKENYTILKDKYLEITPTIMPQNATNKEYTISSDNENIVKIVNGKLYGVNEGNATVTFTTKDMNKTVTANIEVKAISQDEKIIFGENIQVDDEKLVISKIEPQTKVSDILSKIKYNKEKYDIEVESFNNKKLTSSELIGTGSTIKFIFKETGDVILKYNVLIYGDVNGDGKIYATDYVKIKNHIMDQEKLDGIFMLAADVNRDEKIYATDYVKIKNYIMGTGQISQ